MFLSGRYLRSGGEGTPRDTRRRSVCSGCPSRPLFTDLTSLSRYTEVQTYTEAHCRTPLPHHPHTRPSPGPTTRRTGSTRTATRQEISTPTLPHPVRPVASTHKGKRLPAGIRLRTHYAQPQMYRVYFTTHVRVRLRHRPCLGDPEDPITTSMGEDSTRVDVSEGT